MSETPFKLSVEELNYLVVATLVTGAAFTAWSGSLNIKSAFFYVGVAFLALALREFGQRTIAHWMEGQVDLSLSVEGSMTTVFGAMLSVITGLPIIATFPVSNSFDLEAYEHWGKSIDGMWLKREVWIVYGGVASLFAGWAVLSLLGFGTAANAVGIFALFQMMPFDYDKIPTGELDGAYILKQNGFFWLIFLSAWLLIALI